MRRRARTLTACGSERHQMRNTTILAYKGRLSRSQIVAAVAQPRRCQAGVICGQPNCHPTCAATPERIPATQNGLAKGTMRV